MEMDDGMGDMTMMVMTFGSFRDYKLKLLWDNWDITEEWQYVLSWLAVFLAVVLYHAIHYVRISVEVAMRKKYDLVLRDDMCDIEVGSVHAAKKSASENALDVNGLYSLLGSRNETSSVVSTSRNNAVAFRMMHALLGGISYGLAMLLMLVAMTYNPGLFMALVAGYVAGDFIFFRLSGSSPDSGCH